tara:strand:+ start:751 stop:972 length:222 start_codon:yes stop_codon:yes gene_type:complete
MENWQVIGGSIALLMAIVIIPKSRGVLMSLLGSILTEDFIKKLLILSGDKLVNSTKNNLDDALMDELKKKLNE